MRIFQYPDCWLAGLILLLASLRAAPGGAAEPRAAFVLKNGWVECALKQDGQPVAGAVIQVIDERGTNFADGQTAENGEAAFPLPRGSSFILEIKSGGRTADPIRLFKMDQGIEPARVLLSYGLRPCCRFKSRSEAAPATLQPAKRDLAKEARADLERRNFRPLSASLEALLADRKYEPIPTQAFSFLLQTAPDFTLPDVNGKEWSLARKLQEGPVVLVFYYGYHCNHCVSQLFALDKDMAKFRELGVNVVAVSADPPEVTRERFKQFGAFEFPVLADPRNKVAQMYETYTKNPSAGQEGDLLHGTFVITRKGRVVWGNRGEGPFTENRTLLHEAARVEGRLPAK